LEETPGLYSQNPAAPKNLLIAIGAGRVLDSKVPVPASLDEGHISSDKGRVSPFPAGIA